MLRKSSIALALSGYLLSLSQPINANTLNNIDIPHTSETMDLDGELNENFWQSAKVISLDIVNSPYDNTPAPVKTTARIIENGEYIYVSFIAEDPNPESIQATLGNRDTKWWDDLVGIKIDTLNNRRTSYNFFINALGVQNDEIYDEINQEPNDLWDGIWHSYGKITNTGYQVEVALPFSMLNFEQSSDIKTWPIELMRSYPRDTSLRLSHVPLDRDNNCWVCQYPSAQGFKDAQVGHNVTLTPALVLSKEQSRDIYDDSDDWHDDDTTEASLDLRWGITTSTLLNATINPDFSAVESDAGQLNINETFSLFYDEKRPFFIENSEFFSSPSNLVYTRNIADPDYGVKLTGSQGKHNYGVLVSHDSQTNFILSGNLSARVASIASESHSSALRYRFDANEQLSLGAISTLRTADGYHNYVLGVDGSYRFTESDLLTAQWLNSNTKYPNDLFRQFCRDGCQDISSTSGNEQLLRSQNNESFNDNAYNIKYSHNSEYWQLSANHESFGQNFKADLGFIPRTDQTKNGVAVKRKFYSDEQDNFWQDLSINGHWNITHSENGELISKEFSSSLVFDGPLLSLYEIKYTLADRVGLRDNQLTLAIDDNTEMFSEDQLEIYAKIRPTNNTFYSIIANIGDKIDYENNRQGKYYRVKANFTWNPTRHTEFDIYQTVSELEADGDRVYLANLTDFRLTYYFDAKSYLKVSVVYSDINQNEQNNPNNFYSQRQNNLSTQIIYAYKLNPQTAVYVGYSDSSYEDDYLDKLTREQRTLFAKLTYAWQS